ncbi:MAG: transglutaminase-like cysteine peptidase [Geminicoccaceae bacterium]
MIFASITALSVVLSPLKADAGSALFGTVEFRADHIGSLPQWTRVMARIGEEEAVYEACSRDAKACPNRGMMAWQAVINAQNGGKRLDQVKAINRFVNQWQYREDRVNFGRSDHWASPGEFLRRSGDCEDYAITKYVSLRKLGFTPDQLRLVVLQDVLRDVAHAVLAVYLDGHVYILDNLTNSILPDKRISHYLPYYSVNELSRWAHVKPAGTVVAAHGGDLR